jgi:6-pyruvoyltetrahydropterin/6-carboxytetrahydropterin synthase
MITCTRRFSFCAGHRLLGHEGRCRFPHGHNYVAEVTVWSSVRNSLGMVVDFSALKEHVGGWIDKCWDHAFIVNPNDKEMRAMLSTLAEAKVAVMPLDRANPTAENMAEHLAEQARDSLRVAGYDVEVASVRMAETESSVVEWRAP